MAQTNVSISLVKRFIETYTSPSYGVDNVVERTVTKNFMPSFDTEQDFVLTVPVDTWTEVVTITDLPVSRTAYFYAEAPASNPSPMALRFTDGSGSGPTEIATLKPGSFTWIPLRIYQDTPSPLMEVIQDNIDDLDGTLIVYWGYDGPLEP